MCRLIYITIAAVSVNFLCAVRLLAEPTPTGNWTECVDLTGKTCGQVCGERSMVCTKCTTSRDYPGWGAEAWQAGQDCKGAGAGQSHCDFVGDEDPAGRRGPRWKCCCAERSDFVTRPICYDSDDEAGGTSEGAIIPHAGKLFEKSESSPFIFRDPSNNYDCGNVPCREGKPWDVYYNNSGVNPLKRGRTWGNDPDGRKFEQSDSCKDERTLLEYFCSNYLEGSTLLASKEIPCPASCRDGQCLPGAGGAHNN